MLTAPDMPCTRFNMKYRSRYGFSHASKYDSGVSNADPKMAVLIRNGLSTDNVVQYEINVHHTELSTITIKYYLDKL